MLTIRMNEIFRCAQDDGNGGPGPTLHLCQDDIGDNQ